mmetsp:Transcript_90669/g.234116  ORF Transcript_90669/g.234116 Transcript_90669/m.234116 type:complete len:203 (+) Transcript_90669:209-817(+)
MRLYVCDARPARKLGVGRLEDTDVVVAAGGCYRHRNTPHCIRRPVDRVDRSRMLVGDVCHGLPEARRVGWRPPHLRLRGGLCRDRLAGGRQVSAGQGVESEQRRDVRGRRDAALRVGAVRLRLVVGRGRPDAQRAVVGAGHEVRACRVEAQSPHRALMGRQRLLAGPVVTVRAPYLDGVVIRAGEEHILTRVPLHHLHILRV